MNDTDATLVAAYARSWTRPDRARLPALVAEDTTLDYAALHERVARAAGALRAAGVAAGDFVAVAMERSLEQLIAILGAMAAGACPCPLEPRLADEETARRVAEVGLAWMLHDPRTRARPPSGLPAARLLPAERLALGEPAWAQALAPDAPALLLFTSGSTGHPKGVLLSHRGLMNNARGVLAHSGLTPDDRLVARDAAASHQRAEQPGLHAAAGRGLRGAGRFRAEDMPGLGALAPHHHDRRADHVRAHAGPGIRTRQPGGPALRALRLGADHRGAAPAHRGLPGLSAAGVLRPVGGDLHLDHESARAARGHGGHGVGRPARGPAPAGRQRRRRAARARSASRATA